MLDSVIGKRVPRSCDTRWASRSKIVHVLNSEWHNLILVFRKIIDDPSSAAESINGAKGFLKNLKNFEFAFLTVVYNDLFNITDLLFNILQNKSLDVNFCRKHIDIAASRIQNLRTDANFTSFYELAKEKNQADDRDDRSKRMRFDSAYLDSCQFYKTLFFEIIDNITMQLEIRFRDLGNLNYFALADSSKFQEYRNCFPYNLSENLTRQFTNVFDLAKFNNELSVIYNDDQFQNLKLVEILKLFVDNELQEIFSEAYKLFVLITTIPVTTASVERNFSCLKRIKSYSRNSMCQSRLTSLSLLSIEKELLCSMYQKEGFYDEIIKRFSLLKDRRLDLIYKT